MFARLLRSSVLHRMLVAGGLLAPAFMHAQQAAPSDERSTVVADTLRDARAATVPLPAVSRARPDVPHSASPRFEPAAGQERSDSRVGMGSHLALMGVGVATAIIGANVGGTGGTMISLGGGVIFLVGLFRFLQ